MRKSQTRKMSEVLREYFQSMRLENKLIETRVLSQWEEMMGRSVASRTKRIIIKDKILFVYLTSSIVRNELMMMRQSIIEKFNEKAGKVVIEKIVLR